MMSNIFICVFVVLCISVDVTSGQLKYGNKTFLIDSKTGTFGENKAYCESIGTSMAYVQGLAESDYIARKVGNRNAQLFLGAKKEGLGYKFLNGSDFFLYRRVTPKAKCGQMSGCCAVSLLKNGYLAEADCETSLMILCQRDPNALVPTVKPIQPSTGFQGNANTIEVKLLQEEIKNLSQNSLNVSHYNEIHKSLDSVNEMFQSLNDSFVDQFLNERDFQANMKSNFSELRFEYSRLLTMLHEVDKLHTKKAEQLDLRMNDFNDSVSNMTADAKEDALLARLDSFVSIATFNKSTGRIEKTREEVQFLNELIYEHLLDSIPVQDKFSAKLLQMSQTVERLSQQTAVGFVESGQNSSRADEKTEVLESRFAQLNNSVANLLTEGSISSDSQVRLRDNLRSTNERLNLLNSRVYRLNETVERLARIELNANVTQLASSGAQTSHHRSDEETMTGNTSDRIESELILLKSELHSLKTANIGLFALTVLLSCGFSLFVLTWVCIKCKSRDHMITEEQVDARKISLHSFK